METTTFSRQAALTDDRLPALPELLGDGAISLLAAAALPGAEVVDARPTHVSWQVGRSVTVRYQAQMRMAGCGDPVPTSVVATSGGELPLGAIHLGRDEMSVAIWQLPADPNLPGLAAAMSPDRARQLVDQLDAPRGDVFSRLRAYRPGRRAVVELSGDSFRLFAKIVKPGEVAALQERHRIISDRLPVPRTHGWSAPLGLVMLEARRGSTLREALSGGEAPLPPPAALEKLLDAIPDCGDGRLAPSPLASAIGHAPLLRNLVPETAADIDALCEAFANQPEPGPRIPVHGDFYEAQILTEGGAVTGIIDIDTVGLGYRVDDLTTLLGHLVVWESNAASRTRVRNYARQVLALADRRASPVQVRLRVAAEIVCLATGPFRVQSGNWPAETNQRLALAKEWLASAREISTRARRRVLVTGTSRRSGNTLIA